MRTAPHRGARPAWPPRAQGGLRCARGPAPGVPRGRAERLAAARPGERRLPPERWPPTAGAPAPETTWGGAQRGRAARGGGGDGLGARAPPPRPARAGGWGAVPPPRGLDLAAPPGRCVAPGACGLGASRRGPAPGRAAPRRGGRLRLDAAARGAPGGSRRARGARRGPPPEGPPRGPRTGDTVWGALADVSGRCGSPGLAGRVASAPAPACGPRLRTPPTPPLGLRHAGARAPPSAAPHACVAAHGARLTAAPLLASALADQPMASRWTQTPPRATHTKYGKACTARSVSGEKALADLATQAAAVAGLLGRYGEESGLACKQAAEISTSKPERL